ncbi:MAG: hypothetical protein EZS28_025520 [Streblomastix strix]|uniref:Uncharacterized protein n=1 Tax=Streblomastix strix TaxID=222440 RepID=A0A5J4V8X8_9EUKA|nr:MAG: hypothetical protein EZS28_025520 [Streblomastix strix]
MEGIVSSLVSVLQVLWSYRFHIIVQHSFTKVLHFGLVILVIFAKHGRDKWAPSMHNLYFGVEQQFQSLSRNRLHATRIFNAFSRQQFSLETILRVGTLDLDRF